MYLYKIRNLVNGKYYVGQTINDPNKRWRSHLWELRNGKHCNEKLQRAWEKYGEDSFVFEIVSESCSISALNEEEVRLIQENKNGYNVYGGGDNRIRPPSTGKKISKSRVGHVVSAETRLKISQANKGKSLTEEQRKRHRESMQGEKNGFFGKRHSEITKLRLCELNTGAAHPQYGKPRTESTKQKISERGRKYHPCGLISPSGEIFTNITNVRQFCRTYGLDSSALSRLFSGKSKSHRGWRRIDE